MKKRKILKTVNGVKPNNMTEEKLVMNSNGKHVLPKITQTKLTVKKRKPKKRHAANLIETQEANDTIKHLTDERAEEKKAFEQAKSDDEAAIALLEKVLESLSKFYDKNINKKPKAANFLQKARRQEPEFKKSKWQAPDADFSDAGHRQGESAGIISTLEMVVGDLKNEVKRGEKDEEESIQEFDAQVADLKALIDELEQEAANLEQTIADRDAIIVEQEGVRDARNTDADGRQAAIDGDRDRCDHAVANFEQRREKRAIEKEGLNQAKAYLASAPHVALLETPESHFLDNGLFASISAHVY